MNIREILRQSVDDARHSLVMGTSPATLARARERSFVKCLAARLGANGADEETRVFSSFSRGNQVDFGAERLLFDIEVCRVANAETADRKREPFVFIAASLWQVEVAFDRDWRTLIQALNRLTCGAAPNKLLVAPLMTGLPETLAPAAAACPGQLALALMPHPADWEDAAAELETWRMNQGEWQPLT